MGTIVRDAIKLLTQGSVTAGEVLTDTYKMLWESELTNWSNCYISKVPKNELRPISSSSVEYHLEGVPMAIKDNFCTKGVQTTAGSRALHNFVPTYDAIAVSRLKQAGVIITGKTNMDEFGMGSTGLTSYFGPTKGLHEYELLRDSNDFYLPGGSSSGSAVAVALGTATAALGSDTGGSVRLPAAYCGLVGLKPSYGRIPRYGLIAYASSLDCPGILANNVKDASVILDTIAGPDCRDSTCIRTPFKSVTPLLSTKSDVVKGMRIGIPIEFYVEELPEASISSWKEAAKRLEDMGASVEEVSLPSLRNTLAAYYMIATSEASSNLARYDGVRYGYRCELKPDLSLIEQYTQTRTEAFGEEVKKRILTGSYVLSKGVYEECYERAILVRKAVSKEFDEVFKKVDALISPVSPYPCMKLSEIKSKDISTMNSYVVDCMTVPASLAGIPAVAVPFDTCERNLPLSIQVMAPFMMESTALAVALALENNR